MRRLPPASLVLAFALAACHDATGPAPADGRYAAVAAGNLFSCALTRDGRAFCWGEDMLGQLGREVPNTYSLVPVAVGGGHRFTAIAAGDSYACGLDAEGAMWCWGSNASGQLGAASTGCSSVLIGLDCAAPPVRINSASLFRAFATGRTSACGVTAAGGVECWGTSSYLSPLRSDPPPTAVSDSGYGHIAIASSGSHACTLTGGGGLRCWGSNSVGQLGVDTLTPCGPMYRTCDTILPATPGRTWTAVTMGEGAAHTCALDGGGRAWCWGTNGGGVLGHAGAASSFVPASVDSSFVYRALASGPVHTCGLRGDGAAYCWGVDGDGRLGHAAASQVQCAYSYTTVACWPSPVRVGGGDGPWVAITAGATHSCGVTDAGSAWCWGTNAHGELGTGDTVSSRVPLKVAAPDTTL